MWDNDNKMGKYYERLMVKKINDKFGSTLFAKHLAIDNEVDISVTKLAENSKYYIELKADTYKSSKNLFIETIANTNKNTVGGPYQAKKYNANYYFYWFINDDYQNLFVFGVDELINWLDLNGKHYRSHDVKNGSYYTRGLLIPKADVQHLGFCSLRTMKVLDCELFKNIKG
jgi:hypothetical protein